ncbi:hypothetical protein B0T21DRAFT_451016 [Apiosordaria backusii]|uniref:Uncharacterized protein n=1 Tax=Apiosordaria backusii TaxID=314023 RepID=A0AA40BL92_9PEZI|nr:hypothetical protein B0T21DRAFT_451016 [Apiosordaria backusii]
MHPQKTAEIRGGYPDLATDAALYSQEPGPYGTIDVYHVPQSCPPPDESALHVGQAAGQDNSINAQGGRERKVNVDFTIPTRRDRKATGAVLEYAKRWTGPRPITSIVIKNVPVTRGGMAWHSGGSNSEAPEHVTAQLYDDEGQLITTVHVDRDGKIC